MTPDHSLPSPAPAERRTEVAIAAARGYLRRALDLVEPSAEHEAWLREGPVIVRSLLWQIDHPEATAPAGDTGLREALTEIVTEVEKWDVTVGNPTCAQLIEFIELRRDNWTRALAANSPTSRDDPRDACDDARTCLHSPCRCHATARDAEVARLVARLRESVDEILDHVDYLTGPDPRSIVMRARAARDEAVDYLRSVGPPASRPPQPRQCRQGWTPTGSRQRYGCD